MCSGRMNGRRLQDTRALRHQGPHLQIAQRQDNFSGSFHSGAYSACMPRCSLANQSMPPTCQGRRNVMHVQSFLAAGLAPKNDSASMPHSHLRSVEGQS